MEIFISIRNVAAKSELSEHVSLKLRLISILCVLSELDRMSYEDGHYHPTILTGDLNANAKSEVYSLITQGRIWPSKRINIHKENKPLGLLCKTHEFRVVPSVKMYSSSSAALLLYHRY